MAKPAPVPFQPIPRPSGSGEALDCTVRALSNATGMTYAEAHALAAALGRAPRRCLPHRETLALFDAHGTRTDLVKRARAHIIDRPYWRGSSYVRHTKVGRVSLARFLAEHPTGTFVCHIRGHVFAVRDGVVLDNQPQAPRALVDIFWTVTR